MVPVRPPRGRGRRAGADRRDLRGGRPAGRSGAGRRLLLRAAEELRRRRRPVGGAAEPGRAGARSRGSSPGAPAALDPARSSRSPTALENSLKDQTYNTPAVATLFLLADQIAGCSTAAAWTGAWRARGVLAAPLRAGRSAPPYATPFVADPAKRSLVVGTIDFDDAVDAAASPRRCAPTGSSTSSPTASSGATSCGSACSRRSSPPTCSALTACIDWVAGEDRADERRRGIERSQPATRTSGCS